MQPSADISQDPGPLVEQPIAMTNSSQYNFPKVSRHAVALSAFKPVTSPNQNIFATIALKAIAEMQASADSNKTCNRFNITQPIFQSIDAFISQVLMKRSITQLLLPTVPKINGICQHQSILNLVD
jgi:hypothetical protein